MNPPVPASEPRWSRLNWVLVIGILAGAQVGILLGFARWPVLPTVPPTSLAGFSLTLGSVGNSTSAIDSWTADPRQFALPDPAGFSGVAERALPVPEYRLAEWSSRPHWLGASPQPERLGAAPTLAHPPISTSPQPSLSRPPGDTSTPLVLPRQSTASLRGNLGGRAFTALSALPTALGSDVLAGTVIELAVSPGGEVMLTRLASSSGNREADVTALDWARTLHFAPTGPDSSPSLSNPTTWTSGELVVVWHVQPSLR